MIPSSLAERILDLLDEQTDGLLFDLNREHPDLSLQAQRLLKAALNKKMQKIHETRQDFVEALRGKKS